MFLKKADSAYFGHNGGQTTLSRKGKVDFFESLGMISYLKSNLYKKVYTGRQLAPTVHLTFFC